MRPVGSGGLCGIPPATVGHHLAQGLRTVAESKESLTIKLHRLLQVGGEDCGR